MSTTAPDRNELPYLTSLRGLSAMAVLAFHCNWIDWGNQGVDVFFMLSGYILTWGHMQKPRSPVAFWIARVKRIFPTHIVATFLVGSVIVLVGGDTIWRLVADIALFPILADSKMPVNGTTWSLAVEWLAYLAFPFFIGAFRRAPVIGVVFCGAAYFSTATIFPEAGWLPCIWRGVSEFGIGAALAGSGWEPRCHEWLNWIDSPPVRFLGDISFPLYLIQALPLFLLCKGGHRDAGVGFVPHIEAALVALLLAISLHLLVEQPAQNWFKKSRTTLALT